MNKGTVLVLALVISWAIALDGWSFLVGQQQRQMTPQQIYCHSLAETIKTIEFDSSRNIPTNILQDFTKNCSK